MQSRNHMPPVVSRDRLHVHLLLLFVSKDSKRRVIRRDDQQTVKEETHTFLPAKSAHPRASFRSTFVVEDREDLCGRLLSSVVVIPFDKQHAVQDLGILIVVPLRQNMPDCLDVLLDNSSSSLCAACPSSDCRFDADIWLPSLKSQEDINPHRKGTTVNKTHETSRHQDRKGPAGLRSSGRSSPFKFP